MGAQSLSIMHNLASLSHSKLPCPHLPVQCSSWPSMTRSTTCFKLPRSASYGSLALELSQKRNGLDRGQCKATISAAADASKFVQEKKKQNSSSSADIDEDIAKIKRLFSDSKSRQTSFSAYDTAWVAMVPSTMNTQEPQFPQCLSWIMENQLWDGSWGLAELTSIKDRLYHTLASIITLRRWSVGNQNVEMGLRYIRKEIAQIDNDIQHSPIGFGIIFSAMLEDAKDLCLELPYDAPSIKLMLAERDKTLNSMAVDNMNEYDASMIYMVEGIRRIVDWDKVLRHQSKDGSLCHSPSATACALIHTRNPSCLRYLNLMLQNLGDGVPNVYPINLFTTISMVDRLEQLGIARHFKHEIKNALDDVCRCWTHNEIIEELPSALGMVSTFTSFRILRWNGYHVSPDVFISYFKDEEFIPSLEKSSQAVAAMLNLYKASQMMLPGESILQETKCLSRDYLDKRKTNNTINDQTSVLKDLQGEVNYALKVPWWTSLQRLEHRTYMEQYGVDDTWIGKTAYKIPCISNSIFLTLAKKDYNICQEIHQRELHELEKWYADCKFENLKFARQKLLICYFSVASTLFSPEMSSTRMVWTKQAVLTTVIDDFYDVGHSMEELQGFHEAVRRWDPKLLDGFSKNVQILFSALYNTTNYDAQNACACQGRDVSKHIHEIWDRTVNSMMEEAHWAKTGYIPTFEEYMVMAEPSFAIEPIVLLSLYFVGPKLSDKIISHSEYDHIMQLLNICGRLLNDIMTYKMEAKQGKLNSVSLYMKEHPTSSAEDAFAHFRKIINDCSQELLKIVLEPTILPRDCKQLHLNMLRIVQLMYLNTDGFSSPTEMLEHINRVIFNPVL